MKCSVMLKPTARYSGKVDVWYSSIKDLEFVRVLLDSVGEIEVEEYYDITEESVHKGELPVIMVVKDLKEADGSTMPDSPNYILTSGPDLYKVIVLE